MTTAAELIRESYILGGVLDPQEEIGASYSIDGLSLLNQLLQQWSGTGPYIPYVTQNTIQVAQNVYQYSISPEIAEFLEANIIDTGNIQNNLQLIDLKNYNLLNYTSPADRPKLIYVSDTPYFSTLDGSAASLISLYPIPDKAYTLTIYSKQQLATVVNDTNLNFLPPYYIKPLKYQLAKDLSDYFETVTSEKFDKEYMRLMKELEKATPKDMRINTTNPLLSFRIFRPSGYYVG